MFALSLWNSYNDQSIFCEILSTDIFFRISKSVFFIFYTIAQRHFNILKRKQHNKPKYSHNELYKKRSLKLSKVS